MTVVQSDSVEISGGDFSVLLHVFPQVWAILRSFSIAEFDTVTPAHQLPAEVHIGAYGVQTLTILPDRVSHTFILYTA